MDYNFAEWGLALGGQMRYIDSFPMSSGVYVGEVDSYTVLDLNLTYRLPLEQDLVLQVDASNVLDQAYQSFVRRAGGGPPRLRASGAALLARKKEVHSNERTS